MEGLRKPGRRSRLATPVLGPEGKGSYNFGTLQISVSMVSLPLSFVLPRGSQRYFRAGLHKANLTFLCQQEKWKRR